MWQRKLTAKYPVLGSSEDPDKISRTITSAIPFIVLLTATLNLNISQSDIEMYVLAIGTVISGLSTLYYGVLRLISWWKQRK